MWLSTRDLARLGLLMSYQGKWGDKQVADGGFLSWSTSLVTPFSEINPTPMRNAGMPMRWGYGRLWWVWDAPVFPGNTYDGPFQGAYTAMGTGGQFITIFPMIDLVVVHKVDIDSNPAANISQLGYQAILDMLLDARCSGECK
jgi:CubicO group peptidase (beta-lactamase class C family)